MSTRDYIDLNVEEVLDRISRGLGQRAIAEELGVSQATISRRWRTFNNPKNLNRVVSAPLKPNYEVAELRQQVALLARENQRLHKELMSANRNQRKAISTKLRFQVFQRDGFRCKCCGKIAGDGVELQVDHIQPVAKGGTNDLQNLQTLCRECNSGKRTETVDFEEVKAVVPVVTTKPASPLKSNFKQKPIIQSLF